MLRHFFAKVILLHWTSFLSDQTGCMSGQTLSYGRLIEKKYLQASTYVYAYIHTYIHTYLPMYIPTNIHRYIDTYLLVPTHIHTYLHTYLPTYLSTYTYLTTVATSILIHPSRSCWVRSCNSSSFCLLLRKYSFNSTRHQETFPDKMESFKEMLTRWQDWLTKNVMCLKKVHHHL